MKKHTAIIVVLIVVFALTAMVGCAPTRIEDKEFVAYTLSDVVMTQLGINTYRFDFDVDCGDEQVNVYFTERDRLKESDTAEDVDITVHGEKAHFTFTKQLQLSEEYYLWVIGSKQVELPITAPSMFPNMERTDGGVMFHFNYSYNVSWSSFCDPMGRAVYVSDKAAFDESATVLREGIKITEQDYIIHESEYDTNKFYYSVTTAKNGLLKIVSAPISILSSVYEEMQNVQLSFATVQNKPTMKIDLTFTADGVFASEQAQDLQLFVKNDIGDEIYSSLANWSNGVVTFLFDCSNLITAGKWYDVCLAYRGAMVGDIPCRIGNTDVDLSATCPTESGIIFKFANFEGQLKVYYEYPSESAFDKCNFTVRFDADTESLVLTITKLNQGETIPTFAITAGSTERLLEAFYRRDGDNYVYTINLSSLPDHPDEPYNPDKSIWYDVRLFFDSVCAEIGKDAAVDFGAEFNVGNRVYQFREYEGWLKISFYKINGAE